MSNAIPSDVRFSSLPENIRKRERAILVARRNGKTFAEIGRAHGLSGTGARLIYERAVYRANPETATERELSTRTINALKHDMGSHDDELHWQPWEGVLTPELIAGKYTMASLKRVPSMGVKSIKELQNWLIKYGKWEEPVL